MKDGDKYSCTSNVVKLLKHLGTLKEIQEGRPTPIMVHMIPTHKCQLKCVHCCFRNRKDKLADMEWKVWLEGMHQFIDLGTKAFEFTGGGDPLLWPHINDAIDFIWMSTEKLHAGLITNGLALRDLKHPEYLDWIRVSLNTLDYIIDDGLEPLFEKNIRNIMEATSVSFCYIWNKFSDNNIGKVVEFSNRLGIVCRMAPDCIQTPQQIEAEVEHIAFSLQPFKDNEKVFLSDFNVKTVRKNNHCYIHTLKPCFYLDGWIYACPSAELAIENNRQVADSVRVCTYDQIFNYYTSEKAIKHKEFDCSYCKYVEQNELIEALLMPTDFNDFA
jgi:MoaA/NifB/PqqE/SkfB family radical SAM enzyme